ncbi:hypothetical protein [Helicobacter canis]|nr:hypothetical protein [Helicobacter canis]
MDSSTTMFRIVFLESTFDLPRFSVIARHCASSGVAIHSPHSLH